MGQFVDSLTIAIGLDTTQVAEGIQRVAHEIESGLTGAVDAVAPAIEGISEEFSAAAEEAAGLAEATSEVGEAAASAADAGANAGRRGQQAARGVRQEVGNTARDIRTELPRAAQQAAAGIDSAFARVKAGFKGFIAQILGPMAGAFAIGGAVSTFMNGAMAAEEAGQAFNVSAEELQLWQGAITRAGGSVSKFEMSLRKMTMSGKSAGDALKTLHDLAGQAEKMSREAFTAKAKELGIDAATIGVLAQGQKALDAHLKRAKEIGIYEKRHIEQAKRLKIGLWELGGAFDGLKNELLLMVLPAMEKLLGFLTDLTLVASEHAPLVAAAIGLVGAALTFKLLPPLRTLPKLIMGVGRAFLRWLPFVAIIAGLAMMIDDLYAYMTGGNSRFKELWSIFGTGPEVMAKVTNAWKDFKKWGEEVWEGIKTKAQAFWDWMDQWGILDGIANAFKGLAHVIHGFFSDTEEGSQEMWDGLAQLFGGLWDVIAGPFKAAGAWIGEALSDAIDSLEETVAYTFSRLGSIIGGWIDGIASAAGEVWDSLLDGLESLAEDVSSFFDDMEQAVAVAFSAIAGLASAAWDSIGDAVDSAAEWLSGLVDDVEDAVAGAISAVAGWVGGIGDAIGEGLDAAAEWLSTFIDDIEQAVADFFSSLFDVELPDFGAIADAIWNAITGIFDKIKEWVGGWFKGLFSGISMPSLGDLFGGAGGKAAEAVSGGIDMVKSGLGKVAGFYGDVYGTIFGTAKDALGKAGDFFSGLFGDAQPATAEAGAKVEDGMAKTAGTVKEGFDGAWKATAGFAVQTFQGAASTIQQIFSGIVSGIETQVGNLVAGAQAMAPGMVPAGAGVRAPARMQAAGGRGNVTVNQQNRINVDARGGDPAKVQRGVERGINPGRVTRAAASGTVPK